MGSSHCYRLRDGILYRVAVQNGSSTDQIVVPTSLRNSVLFMAHDALLAGHCGVKRTLYRLRLKKIGARDEQRCQNTLRAL